MKMYLSILLCVLFIGCKGPQGDKGETGIQGLRGNPGPGQIITLTGAVSSDDFTVTDSRIFSARQINVYVNTGSIVQLPIFLPGSGVNCFYAVGSSQIEIFKAQLAGASSYVIVLLLP